MRSRYSAFALCNEPYLLSTWHSSTRPTTIPFESGRQWLGLRIVEARSTGATTAEVEFVARSRVPGRSALRHHERSRFVLEGDRWLYVDGDIRA